MDITKKAVAETSILHLRSADDVLLYDDGADGKPDHSKPVTIELYGPGSKPYNAAKSKAANKMLEKLRRKSKVELTAEEQDEQQMEQLIACTIRFNHIEHPSGATGENLFRAVYSDPTLGFIRDQVQAHIGDWGNFTPTSNAA